MIKKFALSIICSVFILSANAQEEIDSIKVRYSDKIHIGLKGGLNFPSVHYSSSEFDIYEGESISKFTWGIFAEFPLNKDNSFSFRPEINFISRGQKIESKDYDVNYKLNAKYTDIYLSFLYTFNKNKYIRPYLAIAPTIGFATGGEIKLNQEKVDISDANLSSVNLGVMGKVGVKIPIYNNNKEICQIGIEAGYYLGLSDTYSGKEKDQESNALNLINPKNYEIQGSRKHRGIETGISISVPLSIFSKKKKASPPPVIIPPIEIVEPPIEIVIPDKECYTLREVKELLQKGEDISGKKICAFEQITFEFGKSKLNVNAQEYLNEIVKFMQESKVTKIIVKGHTDNVGTPEYNLELSRVRAKSVYDYLVSKGISSSKLSYKYFGLTDPIADNETEEGRAMNRRVEFEIVNQ